jgi:hypothetical protein
MGDMLPAWGLGVCDLTHIKPCPPVIPAAHRIRYQGVNGQAAAMLGSAFAQPARHSGGSALGRQIYYVVDTGSGEWEVRSPDAAPQDPQIRYASEKVAIEAAVRFARTDWRSSRVPTGVRVYTPLGSFRDECTFGPDEDAA